ncbi:uncharacterized protein LOC142175211 [Nicotiana tabacum]|uniref:Uncharacterized protein LOC142175211 n=1 Tax=Nicotiana tabacum TaxID=4097 RepID=A0AC58TKY5_TOBAC
MREICEKFKIVHRNSTAYRQQMNGAVEKANKDIKRILRKIMDNHRQWHEKLSFSLLGYRTTMRTSTGATPYILVYGTEDLYQNRTADAFSRKVKPRQFTLGQLVFKKIFPHQEEAKRKFTPNWKGPYVAT